MKQVRIVDAMLHDKNRYVMHVNGARNFMLEDGVESGADWVMYVRICDVARVRSVISCLRGPRTLPALMRLVHDTRTGCTHQSSCMLALRVTRFRLAHWFVNADSKKARHRCFPFLPSRRGTGRLTATAS